MCINDFLYGFFFFFFEIVDRKDQGENSECAMMMVIIKLTLLTGRGHRGKEENHATPKVGKPDAIQYLYELLLNSDHVIWLNEIKKPLSLERRRYTDTKD